MTQLKCIHKENLHKIWTLHGCDHLLRWLYNKRSCPMGYLMSLALDSATIYNRTLAYNSISQQARQVLQNSLYM